MWPDTGRVGHAIARIGFRDDKAYSSSAIRRHLHSRSIIADIPSPPTGQGHRIRRGPKGSRPVNYDVDDYKA